MSGLFQRIARRRSDESDDATTPRAEGPATPPAPDPPRKRFIGAPADEARSASASDEATSGPSASTSGPADGELAAGDPERDERGGASSAEPANGEPGSPRAAGPADGETQALSPVDQPTALFPLVREPPAGEQAPRAESGAGAAAPVSAADAGSEPVSFGGLAGGAARARAEHGQATPTDETAATPSAQPDDAQTAFFTPAFPAAEESGAAAGNALPGDATALTGDVAAHATAIAAAQSQTAAAAPADGSAHEAADASPQQPSETAAAPGRRPGFRERGRMRRRLRYLRRVRELQVRDLGGLVFDLRRYERKRDDLVAQKIDQIRACDDELRALEQALDERRDVRDVRAAGIGGTCPRCFSIYGSSDRFCAHCGAALGGLAQGPAQLVPPPPPLPPAPPAAAPPTPPPASPQ